MTSELSRKNGVLSPSSARSLSLASASGPAVSIGSSSCEKWTVIPSRSACLASSSSSEKRSKMFGKNTSCEKHKLKHELLKNTSYENGNSFKFFCMTD